jgi:hypothetical protein
MSGAGAIFCSCCGGGRCASCGIDDCPRSIKVSVSGVVSSYFENEGYPTSNTSGNLNTSNLMVDAPSTGCACGRSRIFPFCQEIYLLDEWGPYSADESFYSPARITIKFASDSEHSYIGVRIWYDAPIAGGDAVVFYGWSIITSCSGSVSVANAFTTDFTTVSPPTAVQIAIGDTTTQAGHSGEATVDLSLSPGSLNAITVDCLCAFDGTTHCVNCASSYAIVISGATGSLADAINGTRGVDKAPFGSFGECAWAGGGATVGVVSDGGTEYWQITLSGPGVIFRAPYTTCTCPPTSGWTVHSGYTGASPSVSVT